MNDSNIPGTPERSGFPKLGDFLCFATYTANLAFGKAYQSYLAELGLTYTQWITLLALAEEDGQAVNQLGEKLFLASSTLTPLLKNLEKRMWCLGCVQRKTNGKYEFFLLILGENCSKPAIAVWKFFILLA